MATQINTRLFNSNLTAQTNSNSLHSDVIIVDITGV